MSRDLAIDLGTANTLVYAKGKGLVLNEPTVVALDSRSREVLAIGTDAWQMIGRTPGYIVAERPLRGGAITDFEVTERMLSVLLHRVGVSRINRPKVLICVPSAITAVERRAVKEAARRAGASASYLIEQPMDVRGALEDNVASIVEAAAVCLGEAAPELAQDIMFEGIHLTGGGALLRGMTQRLADATAVPVHLVDTPLECVVQGAGVCLESFDRLKRLFTEDD